MPHTKIIAMQSIRRIVDVLMLLVTPNIGAKRRAERGKAAVGAGICTALVDTWLLSLLPLERRVRPHC